MAIVPPNAVASSSRQSARNGHAQTDLNRNESQEEPVNGRRSGRSVQEDEDEKDEGWTVGTFVDRPIEKSNAVINMIKGLSDQLKEVMKRIEEGMGKATDIAKAMEEASPDGDHIEALEAGLQRAIEQRQIVQIKIGVLEEILMLLRQDETLPDATGLFLDRSTKRTEQYMAKSKRAKFKAVKEYIDFRTSIWEINHPNQACPPMSRFLPKVDGDASDDDDFEMGGTTQNYRCPVTMMPFKDAVTSNTCGHSYSRIGIEGIFTNATRNSRSARCPVAGCSVLLKMDNLTSDKSLQKRADEFEKRRARREEDESDEENRVDISQYD